MSNVMLLGVLRMPISLWGDNGLDQAQRQSRYVQAADEIERLTAENEVLRKDSERLEWLVVGGGDEIAARVMGSDERGWSVADCSNGLTFASRGCETFREAIDQAMLKVKS